MSSNIVVLKDPRTGEWTIKVNGPGRLERDGIVVEVSEELWKRYHTEPRPPPIEDGVEKEITVKFWTRAKDSQLLDDLIYLQEKLWGEVYYIPVVATAGKKIEREGEK